MAIVRDNIGPLNIYLRDKTLSKVTAPDVVMLQGFGTGPRGLRPMAKHLARHGLVCAAAPTGGLFGHLQTKAVRRAGKRLARYLSKLPPDHKPWIIGHSIGGIIGRWAIQRCGAHEHVRGLITLGSPHQGCPAALAGIAIGLGMLSTATWSILPGAPLIRRLNKSPWPTQLPLISITSSSDVLCRPKRGRVRFADDAQIRNVVVDGLGHTEMLRDARLLNIIHGLMDERRAA